MHPRVTARTGQRPAGVAGRRSRPGAGGSSAARSRDLPRGSAVVAGPRPGAGVARRRDGRRRADGGRRGNRWRRRDLRRRADLGRGGDPRRRADRRGSRHRRRRAQRRRRGHPGRGADRRLGRHRRRRGKRRGRREPRRSRDPWRGVDFGFRRRRTLRRGFARQRHDDRPCACRGPRPAGRRCRHRRGQYSRHQALTHRHGPRNCYRQQCRRHRGEPTDRRRPPAPSARTWPRQGDPGGT
jgi:hypothetical protein